MSTPMILTIVFASVLAAVALGLTAAMSAVRVAAPLLAAVGLAASVAVVKGRRQLVWVVIIAGVGVLALLAWHLSQLPTRVPMRSLQLAAALSWAVVLLASVLKLVRIDWSRGLLVGFSLAIPLLIADALVPPAPAAQQTPWKASIRKDPDTGFRYVPNSTAQNFYPDNPRGYFDETKPDRLGWSIETHEGSEAKLEFVETGTGDRLRITIPKLVKGQAWHVKLQQTPLEIKEGTRYMASFEARADAKRPVSCAVGQNHEPWGLIGTYHEFEVGTEWSRFECPFVAASSDTKARLFFDLGKSEAPVELQRIVLTDEASGKPVAPPTPKPEYVINYRFNSLGLRGPDRAIPAPAGTFRIVTLGDSYALGVGVKEEDTVEAQLEKRLNASAAAQGDKTVYEVLNDGVSGYDTRQERWSFERYSSKYEPQIVLLLMVFNDDLTYNDDLAKSAAAPAAAAGRVSSLWGRVEAARQAHTYDYSGSIEQVRQLNESCKRRGAKLTVAIFRNSSNAIWMKLVTDVTGGLRGTGIPVLDLGPAILNGGKSGRDIAVHPTDGHPNEIAHGLAAEAIEQWLRAEHLLVK